MPFYNTRPTASTAQYLAATPGTVLTSDVVWASGVPITAAFGSTITLDFASGVNFVIAATGNFTLANPINAKPGQTGRITITQDATGGRTITYGSAFKKGASDSLALSTAASAVDVLRYDVHTSSFIEATLRKGIA